MIRPIEFDFEKFGVAVKAHMKNGESCRSLGDKLGMSTATVSRATQGKELKVDYVLRLCAWMGKKIEDFYNTQSVGIKGVSTEALVESDFSIHTRKEKSVEILQGMMQKLISGNSDITPFVIGSVDGNIVAEECEINDDGSIQLPEITVNTPMDLKNKSKVVRRIVDKIAPVLKAEIESVTYIALMRKDAKKLADIMEALKDEGIPVKVENRAGCIWLIIGGYEFVI